jgi:hypothetical protein
MGREENEEHEEAGQIALGARYSNLNGEVMREQPKFLANRPLRYPLLRGNFVGNMVQRRAKY